MNRIKTKTVLAAVVSFGLMFSSCRTLDELVAIFEDDTEETSSSTSNRSASTNTASNTSTTKASVNVNSTPDSSGYVARENRNFAQELGGLHGNGVPMD